MTTTKALAKLYKTITGSEGRNSAAKILSDLADNWSATAGSVPVAPSASGNYLLTVNESGVASWIAATSSAIS